MLQLSDFGWDDDLSKLWLEYETDETRPARVVADFGTSLRLVLPAVTAAEVSGKLAHNSDRQAIPKVGDWVAVRLSGGHAVVEAVMPRRSEIARKAPGNPTAKQVIAANVDIAFVLLAMDNDFSVERLKRYLFQLTVSRIQPVIVLNKSDKAENGQYYNDQLQMLGLPILTVAAIDGTGVDEVLECIKPGRTAILLGSSGVGKSTLTNRLMGKDVQMTQAVRASDDTGRHTTVHRELFVLPNGGLLIDTPGIRELQLWGTEDALAENFDDITGLAERCKFSTCSHTNEPGCAVRPALESGGLSQAHYANYLKMKHELTGLKAKQWTKKNHDNRRSHKSVSQQVRQQRREMRDESN